MNLGWTPLTAAQVRSWVRVYFCEYGQSTLNKDERKVLASPTLAVDGSTNRPPKRSASEQLPICLETTVGCAETRVARAARAARGARAKNFILCRGMCRYED
jgi:hypothetical protein